MKTNKFIVVVTLLAAVLSIGCGTTPEPFTYEDERDLKKGPGLFSGKTGEFEIYNSQDKKKESPKNNDKAVQEAEQEPQKE